MKLPLEFDVTAFYFYCIV